MFLVQEKKARYGNAQEMIGLNVTGEKAICVACFATLEHILKQQNVLRGLSAL